MSSGESALKTPQAPAWAIYGGWGVVWLALMLTFSLPSLAPLLMATILVNLIVFLVLNHGQISAFPVQVRLAFVLFTAIGLWVPGCASMLYLPAVGILARLFFGYCLLARMVWLLPWNRGEPLSAGLILRTFLSAPTTGQFGAGKHVQR